MSGTILENLSTKKLSILVGILVICQALCFLIGGLIAPTPASTQPMLGVLCVDKSGEPNNTNNWLWSRGEGHCDMLRFDEKETARLNNPNNLVWVFQMPLNGFDFSRWQQNLVGVLTIDLLATEDTDIEPKVPFVIDARLAFRNKGDPPHAWKYYTSSIEKRYMDCHVDKANEKRIGYPYNCSHVPLFELGSLHHDYYLLNVRLPVDSDRHMNEHFIHVEDVWLAAINQNGGFTKVWVSLKTIFFPIVIAIMVWFWRRVHLLQRSPALLEYMLLCLGAALTFLNAPLEYFTLLFDLPFMLLLSDIRQGIFYAMLLSFWLVFSGEHMLIKDTSERNSLKAYWGHLSAVGIGCVSLFIFEICERGVQLKNPFHSIWFSDIGSHLALLFIILAGLSACTYFVFLCYMIWRVFKNINIKRTALPSMSSARRLHYEGIIYRFKFLMLATLLCAAVTIIWYILGQVAEGSWKWEENKNTEIEVTSAFFTGVYGMWNIYIFALLILYAPSHKQWISEAVNNDRSEEIEFSRLQSESAASEISSLTSFIRKAAVN